MRAPAKLIPPEAEIERRLQLIVNPSSGGGRGATLIPAVESALRRAGHDLVVTATRSFEHADELTAAAVADERVAVAMGGDGMVGRVAGTVAAAGGVLGVIPGGRGNDFARMVGLPKDPVAATAVLADGSERAIDLGDVNGTAFVGIASVGFDSEVQERLLASPGRLGALDYLVGALATVRFWRHATFDCVIDDEPLQLRGWFVAAANTGSYGGGMRLAPQASYDDGLLDVVTCAAMSRPRFLRSLPKVFRGTHVDVAEIDVRRARTLVVSADRPFRVFADGDPVGPLPATFTVRPGALRVLLP
ncbi:MAG TPA: diacylglycerol kinase family protein [Mycobacteriales bacterium]|nr:diacylglycerol kinase family protein [Mycobacteriales bacterium]